nr:glycerol kinase [Actinomycetota bacterium]
MRDLILAVDAGTTGIKVLIVDGDMDVVGRAYSEFSQHFPQPGWVEHDAVEIWTVTQEAMRAALADAKAAPTDIAAIGITDQRETTVLWDRSTGEPVANAIVWQSRQSASICDRLKRQGLEPELRERTGLVCDPYFSATKILWYLENIEGLRARAESGELAFGTIDTWLMWKMTGGTVHATEPSNASRTMLFSLETGTWDPWILETLGIPAEILPEVMPSSGRFGDTEVLGAPLPITGVAGDQQAALFGQACISPGMAKNTYGTGSFLLMNTGGEPKRSELG